MLLNPYRFAAAGGGSSHRYWRIYITATNSADAFAAQIAEMEYRATVGGADQTGSGTATASTSNDAGSQPSAAFDNSTSTSWVSITGAALPQWLAYDFGSAVSVAQISITSGNSSARAARAPKTFDIQWSDNNSSWTTALSVVNESAWGITQTRTYTL